MSRWRRGCAWFIARWTSAAQQVFLGQRLGVQLLSKRTRTHALIVTNKHKQTHKRYLKVAFLLQQMIVSLLQILAAQSRTNQLHNDTITVNTNHCSNWNKPLWIQRARCVVRAAAFRVKRDVFCCCFEACWTIVWNCYCCCFWCLIIVWIVWCCIAFLLFQIWFDELWLKPTNNKNKSKKKNSLDEDFSDSLSDYDLMVSFGFVIFGAFFQNNKKMFGCVYLFNKSWNQPKSDNQLVLNLLLIIFLTVTQMIYVREM